MRTVPIAAAALIALSVAAEAQTPPTAPGTPLGTGAARGSDDDNVKPVPGPGATSGDSSGGRSTSAPAESTGSAPPPAADMDKAPKSQSHGGSSSGGLSGGAVAPARRSGDSAPAGETGTMSR